jgi:hypothetical protein
MKNFARLVRTQWDRAGAAALVAAGLIALLLGWIGMSGTVLTFQQLPYLLSGGLLGFSLITVGAALWLSADVRDEWRKIDRLEAAFDRAAGTESSPVVVLSDVPATADPESDRPTGRLASVRTSEARR